MHETLRRLPSLDFLKGFEASARHLSFTRAAQELFLTQSALSRQVQALEEALGVPLFVRRHRALALTPAGAAFHREVTAALGALIAAADAARGVHRDAGPHAVDHGLVRVAVDHPAAAGVSRPPSRRRGLRVRRRSADRSRTRRRRRRGPLPRRRECARGRRAALRRADAPGRGAAAPAAGADCRSPSPPTSRTTCCCISTTRKDARRGSIGACGSRRTASRA